MLAYARSFIFKNPEYSEATISRLRTSLSSSSIDKIYRVGLTNALAMESAMRFQQYSLSESLEEEKSYTSQVADLSSPESLEEFGIFPVLGPVFPSCSITRMTEKIQQLEELLSNTPPGTDRYQECLTDLADWCRGRSDRTDDMSDLE